MIPYPAAATNSFLVPNAPTKKVQDYKQMKPTEAVTLVGLLLLGKLRLLDLLSHPKNQRH